MNDKSCDPFAIDETPFPLRCPDAGLQPLAAIESELRRLMRERAEALHELEEDHQSGERDKEGLLRDLLEVLDAFARVFSSVDRKKDQVTPQMKRWLKNFSAARRLMQSIMEHHGVRETKPAEGEFDPHQHEALEVVDDPDVPERYIVRQEYPGYTRLGRVLRKAGVVVSEEADQERAPDQLENSGPVGPGTED